MYCPRCGRQSPPGSMVCQYCTSRLSSPPSAKKGTVLRCVKCGKMLPLMGSLVDKKQTCRECDERYARDLADARHHEERRMSLAVSQVIAKHPELRDKIMQRLGLTQFDGRFQVDYAAYQQICGWDRAVTQAKNFELARRFEDAARSYESVGLWKEAGLVRERKTSRTVKHVNVDLNDLIDKLREGGLAIPYKCRACGATITIDGTATAGRLHKCQYCGSTTDTDTLTAILENALR